MFTMHTLTPSMEDLFVLPKGDTPDPDRIRQKAALVGATETERSIAMWDHFRALRALCTKEQRDKFDRIILDVLRQVRGPEPGNGPGGPPPQPPSHPESGPQGQGHPQGPGQPEEPGHAESGPPGHPPGGPGQLEPPHRQ